MPAPIQVELKNYDPAWAEDARQRAAELVSEFGGAVVTVHHIGSTAIPGMQAKPILDLLPVVRGLSEFDDSRSVIEGMGYGWWGEYGLSGRRYCTLDDPVTNRRIAQLHCYEAGSPEIERHLALSDYLRANPTLTLEYSAMKARCRDLHPSDSHGYSDCKAGWTGRIEAVALKHPKSCSKSDTTKRG